jgi:hypothetical protein
MKGFGAQLLFFVFLATTNMIFYLGQEAGFNEGMDGLQRLSAHSIVFASSYMTNVYLLLLLSSQVCELCVSMVRPPCHS